MRYWKQYTLNKQGLGKSDITLVSLNVFQIIWISIVLELKYTIIYHLYFLQNISRSWYTESSETNQMEDNYSCVCN